MTVPEAAPLRAHHDPALFREAVTYTAAETGEDLDFVIPTPTSAARSERSRRAESAKHAVAAVGKEVSGLRVVEPLTGANASAQYNAVIAYRSLLGPQEETIKIEVGLREPLLSPAVREQAHTLLLDPVSGSPLAPVIPLPCLSRREAMAEKLRMPGNGPVDVSTARLAALRPQLEAQLKPVLRDADFALFDLDRAFKAVAEVAAALGAER